MNIKNPRSASEKPPAPKLRRMSGDLVTGLLIIVISAALLVVLVNYLMAASKGSQALEEDADQYLSYLSKSMELPTWSLDDATVKHIGDAFMTSDQFGLLEVLADKYRNDHIYINKKTGETDMVLRRGELQHNGRIIGGIRIGLSRKPYQDEMRRLLQSSLMITAVVILAMVAASWWMLRRFVHQPLNLLMGVAQEMAGGNYNPRAEDIRHQEIALVYEQLMTMAARVKGREVSLAAANEQLTKEIQLRESSEKELRNLQNYLSNIIDSMPSVLVGVDTKGCVTQWNKTAEQITGIPNGKAQGKVITEILPQMDLEMENIGQSIRTRQVLHEQKRPRNTDTETCYEDVTIYPLVTNGVEGAVIRIDNVTEKVRMEEVMIQSEKMLSVGGLAAGMAHEINNPLAGMMQTAEVMVSRLKANSEIPANHQAAKEAGTTMAAIERFMEARGIPRMLATIAQSGYRIATIVQNMLSFARKEDATVANHILSEIIDKTLELAATDYDLKKQYDFKLIEIVRDYSAELPTIPCEAAKIQQVLLNILSNGAQAMQSTGIPRPRFILKTRLNKVRGMAIMEIEDNGPGIDEKTRKRIFEPFFTTKPVGVGTGLGLSVSYFIITENHQGELTVESRPGEGTKFIIRLPLVRKTK